VPRLFATILAAGAAMAGCQNKYGTTPIHDDRGAYNAWTIEAVNDGAVRNATLAQHTLYPYHFVEFSDQLNDLGRRDVHVLATHYRRYPGEVNIRRGGEAASLYDARVRSVAEALRVAGVAPETIRIGDGMPGGDGNPSDRVIAIMQAERQRMMGGAGAPAPGGTPVNASPTSTTGSSGANPLFSPPSGGGNR
jgi:hypothetical protein